MSTEMYETATTRFILKIEAERDDARRELEEALQEAGRLRARVEELEGAFAELPDLIAEAVRQLDAISGGEPEGDHGRADQVLLDFVPPDVRAAYERLVKRATWWVTA